MLLNLICSTFFIKIILYTTNKVIYLIFKIAQIIFVKVDIYISDSSDNSLFLIKQASLKITEKPLQGIIDIENLGTTPAVDVIYTFNIPKNATTDLSTIKAYLNNNAININYKKLDDCVFFKLPVIPEIINNRISKLRIRFNCHNKNSIYISKMTLK